MKFKAILLAIAILFMSSSASAYYVWGGSYGALEYPNSYYSVYSQGYGYDPYYGSHSYYYHYTPYSTYHYTYSSWQPYTSYYYPVYAVYPAYNKEFYWNGFGFNFAYLKNY